MDGKDLAKEAVKDVKSMVDLAVEAAKTEIVEQMTPGLKRLIENQLRSGSKKNEDTDRVRRIKDGYPGESKNEKFEEGKMDDKDKDLEKESLASFFAPISEEEEVSEETEPVAEGEGYGERDDDDEEEEEKKESHMEGVEDSVDEDVEISEEALRQVYEAALQTEVQVKKGFSDFTKGGDFGKDKPDAGGGIVDIKSGEQQWSEADVPAKQDWTVKEMIQRGLAENRALRARCTKLEGYCRRLYESANVGAKKLQEVNLFNAKLLHVTRFLNTHGRMTNEQKNLVIERIERARSVNEVKMVYETIVESFKVAQGLNESTSKKPVANAQRPRTSGAPKHEVLSESVDRSQSSAWSRIQQLAGLKNIK